jgi:hypothetical protein
MHQNTHTKETLGFRKSLSDLQWLLDLASEYSARKFGPDSAMKLASLKHLLGSVRNAITGIRGFVVGAPPNAVGVGTCRICENTSAPRAVLPDFRRPNLPRDDRS